MSIEDKISQRRTEIELLEKTRDAVEQQRSPFRDRMVIEINGGYLASYRYEVNPDNGWLTVMTLEGDILPTRPERWCPFSYATDYFGILRSEITIDDPERGL